MKMGTTRTSGSAHLVEYVLQLVLCQSRTLDVLHRAQFLGHALTVFLPDRLHPLLGELLSDARVVSQIGLCSNNQTWHSRAVVVHFGKPLLPHVLERRWGRHAETDQKDIRLWI